MVQPRDLDEPPDVVVRQPIREKPASELIPLAQSPTVDAQSGFGSINEQRECYSVNVSANSAMPTNPLGI